MSAARVGIVAVVAALLGACGSETESWSVEICGDMVVPDDLDAVRVTVRGARESGSTVAAVRELFECPGPELTLLPLALRLPGVAPEWVVVQGLRRGATVARAEVRVGAAPLEGPIGVRLDRACSGVRCVEGQTCLHGACALAPFEEEGIGGCDAPPPSADVADVTASSSDAAVEPSDGGALTDPGDADDASPADVEPAPDAAVDAGDEGADRGVDTGFEAPLCTQVAP